MNHHDYTVIITHVIIGDILDLLKPEDSNKEGTGQHDVRLRSLIIVR